MTVAAWLEKAVAHFSARSVPEPEANAEFLMAHVLKSGRAEARAQGSRALPEKQGSHFWHLVQERGRRIPLAYVLGSQPFCGLDIEVTPQTLIPRPETEELVERCLALMKNQPRQDPHVLEIGTGTGCVAIALAAGLPDAIVYATEISREAMRLAEKNAMRNHMARRIRFIQEDLFKAGAAPKRWADLVVSNPPYIPTARIGKLAPEVLREPRLALDGGKDGLDAVRAITASAPRFLKPGGFLALEIGSDQGAAVLKLFSQSGFAEGAVSKDLQGLDRIATAKMIE
ncbi:MAG: peptide chain release factor N(5)-glutamine methyltransferase [Elusimicrobia bacterium]|nr:peptide chain release factor N(5)-glutamine methyltransferase [Elusimicrobiota bacterium]